eukprot:2652603-Pyramimonas_sp.AAC.1
MDQSDAPSTGIFPQRTNQTQQARVYSHDGIIRHHKPLTGPLTTEEFSSPGYEFTAPGYEFTAPGCDFSRTPRRSAEDKNRPLEAACFRCSR